jgi:hypothetical protein
VEGTSGGMRACCSVDETAKQDDTGTRFDPLNSVFRQVGANFSVLKCCYFVASLVDTVITRYVCDHLTNLKVAGSRPDEVNDFYQVT